METQDAERAKQLNDLKLELAALASQLDAIEARLKQRQPMMSAEMPPDTLFAKDVVAAMNGRAD